MKMLKKKKKKFSLFDDIPVFGNCVWHTAEKYSHMICWQEHENVSGTGVATRWVSQPVSQSVSQWRSQSVTQPHVQCEPHGSRHHVIKQTWLTAAVTCVSYAVERQWHRCSRRLQYGGDTHLNRLLASEDDACACVLRRTLGGRSEANTSRTFALPCCVREALSTRVVHVWIC